MKVRVIFLFLTLSIIACKNEREDGDTIEQDDVVEQQDVVEVDESIEQDDKVVHEELEEKDNEVHQDNIDEQNQAAHDLKLDQVKWKTKDGKDYPYREQLLDEILYSDAIRALKKEELLDLLGDPDRSTEGYLYYMIKQRRIVNWPLHTKTMVIKLTDDDSIDWIKVHE